MKHPATYGLLLALLLTGCPQGPVRAKFSLEPGAAFFDAPFPVFTRVRADGTLDWSAFPNPANNLAVTVYKAAADGGPPGAANGGAIFLPFTGSIDPATLPATPEESLAPGASAFLLDVDPASPERGRRLPLLAKFKPTGNALRPDHLLAILPYPGVVLRPGTLYAAGVTRGVRDMQGQPLPVVPEVGQTALGVAPEGPRGAEMLALYANLWETLDALGAPRSEVVVATVFRAQDPLAEQRALADFVQAAPTPPATDLARIAEYPEFCVIEGRTDFPIFQDGERPYLVEGGAIRFDEGGLPIVQWTENVRFAVSIPKTPMPAGGYPIVVWGNGTGGDYLSPMNRGGAPGNGPARYLAARGIAMIDTDPVLHGPRSPSGDEEGLLFFNPLNPVAFRDNVRQSAAELSMLAGLAAALTLDAALCPGAGASDFVYDPDRVYFMGQSTGSTVGPLGVAADARFKAGVFSGASANYILQVLLKQSPFPLKPAIELVLGVSGLDEFDPALTMIQHIWEAADPPAALGTFWREPPPGMPARHALMFQGLIDSYSLPRQGATFAAALGVDVVNPVLEPAQLEAIGLAGGGAADAPLALNRASGAGTVTVGLAQYLAEPGRDGHYVIFDQAAPKHRYACFLDTLARAGAAVVAVANDDPFAACP